METFKKINRIFFLSLLITLGIISYLRAETSGSIKIGVIDIKRVINNSKYGQEVMEQLQKKYSELSTKLEAKAKEVEALREEIEKKGTLWTPEMREKKQNEYQKMLRELRTLQEDSQYEMQEYEKKMLDPVFKELEKVLKDFVQKEKYDLIFEKNQPGIYYASSQIDLSAKIVELFDHYYLQKKSKEKTPSKTK